MTLLGIAGGVVYVNYKRAMKRRGLAEEEDGDGEGELLEGIRRAMRGSEAGG